MFLKLETSSLCIAHSVGSNRLKWYQGTCIFYPSVSLFCCYQVWYKDYKKDPSYHHFKKFSLHFMYPIQYPSSLDSCCRVLVKHFGCFLHTKIQGGCMYVYVWRQIILYRLNTSTYCHTTWYTTCHLLRLRYGRRMHRTLWSLVSAQALLFDNAWSVISRSTYVTSIIRLQRTHRESRLCIHSM